MKIVVSDRANTDLEIAYDYLSRHNARAADQLFNDVRATFSDLKQFPMIGRARSDLRASLRSKTCGTHIVFYSIADRTISITRILDARMNIDREMFK